MLLCIVMFFRWKTTTKRMLTAAWHLGLNMAKEGLNKIHIYIYVCVCVGGGSYLLNNSTIFCVLFVIELKGDNEEKSV